MADPTRIAEDLHYIRGLVEGPRAAPASILILWAVIGAPGFALVDLAPSAVPWYWLVAAPIGMVASIWLGRRHAVREGRIDRATGIRWTLHWAGLLAAAGLIVLLAVARIVPFEVINPAMVLLIAITYFLAGIHLDRRLLWVAAALVAAFPTIVFLPKFGWTAAGALVAVAVLGVAASGGRAARA